MMENNIENFEKKFRDMTDERGEAIEIWWRRRLEGSPCVSMIFDGFSELIKKGWSNNTILIDNQHRLVYAVYPSTGEIAGGIAYKWVDANNCVWISLSLTEQKFRGRGINRLCHLALERDASLLGATAVESYVHVDNLSRLRSTEKVGLSPMFYRMHKKLR